MIHKPKIIMKILIIDDEEFFIENLAQYLKKKTTARVSYVSRAEEALNLLEKERFDLVVCDLNLPDQSEGELVVRINNIIPRQRFIIISAKSEQEIPESRTYRHTKCGNDTTVSEQSFEIVSNPGMLKSLPLN